VTLILLVGFFSYEGSVTGSVVSGDYEKNGGLMASPFSTVGLTDAQREGWSKLQRKSVGTAFTVDRNPELYSVRNLVRFDEVGPLVEYSPIGVRGRFFGLGSTSKPSSYIFGDTYLSGKHRQVNQASLSSDEIRALDNNLDGKIDGDDLSRAHSVFGWVLASRTRVTIEEGNYLLNRNRMYSTFGDVSKFDVNGDGRLEWDDYNSIVAAVKNRGAGPNLLGKINELSRCVVDGKVDAAEPRYLKYGGPVETYGYVCKNVASDYGFVGGPILAWVPVDRNGKRLE
tara:strand:+ start:1044 stop:1895 length:852 start_codon:yes stop_codon:yes gene_type:complete